MPQHSKRRHMNESDFKTYFKKLTDHDPLSWQCRLFHEHFAKGDLSSLNVIDIPTGLGKTMVMAIWLIARAGGLNVPTRLIYVVDRRTVVDQASDLAKKLRENFGQDKLAISTLRGQLADNQEWSRDPSRSAIIIGTVDLIGSALLFSGYRSSFKTRPLHAGLLGQDSLLVLDEAHLSKPFEKLVTSIQRFQKNNDKPMRVIRMSATNEESSIITPFNLEDSDLNDAIISQRILAKKQLTITTISEKVKTTDKLADAAIKLANNGELLGKRFVVFVRKPEDAIAVANTIRNHITESVDESGPRPKKIRKTPYADSAEVLTGTMRGLERDELLQKLVLKRFFDGNEDPDKEENRKPVFLVSTSAGEVGFDLNADHLVGDAAPLDSWIQRLGRVNRRGTGDARVILIKQNVPSEKTEFERACNTSADLMKDGMDVSPQALAAFKKSLTSEQLKAAMTPEPIVVELTDILLDAWSMTSITGRMPGRPEVAPWLRGISEWEPPQTTIAWRAELDLPGFADLDLEDIEEWFDYHRVLTHETLNVPTSVAAKWFVDRWNEIPSELKTKLDSKRIVIDRAGFNAPTVKELVDQLVRKSGDITAMIRNADLILPASFGGVERHEGLLNYKAPTNLRDFESNDCNEARLKAPDVADIAPDRFRLRQVITKSEDGETETHPIGGGSKPPKSLSFRMHLQSDEGKRVMLVSYVPRIEKPEFGSGNAETLASHVGKVRRAIDQIIHRFKEYNSEFLSASFVQASRLAANFHDHGKNRERWQRSVGGTATVGANEWKEQTTLENGGRDQSLGKSGGEMKRDPRGYRHEFGSLREFLDAFNAGSLLDKEKMPITQSVFDLAMHLIAAHHGRGRPHFPKGGFDPHDESRSDEIYTEAIRRFARLQRKYGHWQLAWLENLLRCADAMASAQLNNNTDVESGEHE